MSTVTAFRAQSCHSERSEESNHLALGYRLRFFTPFRMTWLEATVEHPLRTRFARPRPPRFAKRRKDGRIANIPSPHRGRGLG